MSRRGRRRRGSSDGPSEASEASGVGQDARPPALSQYIPGGVGNMTPEDLGRVIRELEDEVARRASAAEEEAQAPPPRRRSSSSSRDRSRSPVPGQEQKQVITGPRIYATRVKYRSTVTLKTPCSM